MKSGTQRKGISLKKVNGDVKELPIKFGDEVLTAHYDSGNYTPRLEREMNEKIKQNLPGAMLSTMLLKVLVARLPDGSHGWDLLADETTEIPTGRFVAVSGSDTNKTEPEVIVVEAGEILPLNAFVLDEILGIPAQAKIVEALAEAQRPNRIQSAKQDDTF